MVFVLIYELDLDLLEIINSTNTESSLYADTRPGIKSRIGKLSIEGQGVNIFSSVGPISVPCTKYLVLPL